MYTHKMKPIIGRGKRTRRNESGYAKEFGNSGRHCEGAKHFGGRSYDRFSATEVIVDEVEGASRDVMRSEWLGSKKAKRRFTYNSRDSLVVTHPTTDLPI